MRKIAVVLVALVALVVIGCQPPEGLGVGVTAEQLDELKTEIQTLKTDIAALQTTLEEFTTVYNEHVEKYHKGGKPAPKPPSGIKPPTQK